MIRSISEGIQSVINYKSGWGWISSVSPRLIAVASGTTLSTVQNP